MMRVFIALPLPEEVRGKLSVLQFLLPLPATVPAGNFHLTLAYPGEVSDAVLEAVHEALTALRLPAFDLELAGAGLFGGAAPKVAWAGVRDNPALMRLQAKVETAARRAGAVIPSHRFVPHVTLGRFAPPPPDQAMRLERAVVEQGGFRAGPFPVRGFTLYASRGGGKGVWYEVLAEYGLEDASG